ncbi:MAG: hypothetical protein KDD62_10505, partial [Bdellovibrionales bacterium]|nr:hypothetical protein [Bdellovibrionales bacterium]
MNKEIALQTIQALTLSVMILFGSSFAEAEELSSPLTHNEPKLNLSDQPLNDLLFSSRIEAIFRRSYRGPIREDSSDQSKLYFNALYLNLEGALNHSLDFLIEFQPYVSDLYLLGGFVSVAGPLEGIASGGEEATARARTISEIVHDRIKILDDASDYPSAERVELDYSFDDFTGLRIGRVRNPWGLWDDYSLFRNLSAGKTDPVTLGVQLRRTDYGAIQYGQIAKSLSYELGILTGENSADSIESNTAKDAVGRLNYNFS